jgi:hypothetical protein
MVAVYAYSAEPSRRSNRLILLGAVHMLNLVPLLCLGIRRFCIVDALEMPHTIVLSASTAVRPYFLPVLSAV